MATSERELIERIRRTAKASRAVVRGIGDDCAVLRVPAGHEALVTTDFSIEGVHFRREWHPAEDVGHRCLTRGLSDIAAMGGVPIAAFLSLALPAGIEPEWAAGFLRGFQRLARRHEVTLAGGDTARSPAGIVADVVVLGSVPRGKAVARSGAKVGDDIFITGQLGAPVAVLNRLMERKGGKEKGEAAAKAARRAIRETMGVRAERAHYLPQPRVEVGRWLRERGLASAMIDSSDGLSTDLRHICDESGRGAWIAKAALPIAKGATLADALDGGDNYELIFTAPAAKHDRVPDRIAEVEVRWIGTVTREPGLWLVEPGMKARRPIPAGGWEQSFR